MGYFPVRYDSRVVIYEHKLFIRLATGHKRRNLQSNSVNKIGKDRYELLFSLSSNLSIIFALKMISNVQMWSTRFFNDCRSSVTRWWHKKWHSFAKSWPKSSHKSFPLKVTVFNVVNLKVTVINLTYFYLNICRQELSKRAQSGHTVDEEAEDSFKIMLCQICDRLSVSKVLTLTYGGGLDLGGHRIPFWNLDCQDGRVLTNLVIWDFKARTVDYRTVWPKLTKVSQISIYLPHKSSYARKIVAFSSTFCFFAIK